MAAILSFGGVITLLSGLIGEYIGRIYMTVSDMRQYQIRQMINVRDDNEQAYTEKGE